LSKKLLDRLPQPDGLVVLASRAFEVDDQRHRLIARQIIRYSWRKSSVR
jgi:hypothetical protein